MLQLAIPRMPSSISGIVRIAIRDYVNLNNTELVNQYNGPILMIRRTEDEIIAEWVCQTLNELKLAIKLHLFNVYFNNL